MKFTWTILGLKSTDGLITQAQYYCCAEQKSLSVETQGTWFFREPKITVPFAEVTEEMVIGWIKAQDTEKLIETRLVDQIKNLAAQTETTLPWSPQVFTPKFEE